MRIMQPMTNQEIFDKVCSGLLAQGRPSVKLNPGNIIECRYRSDDGCKCAAGQLIPDDKYNVELEGRASGHERVLAAMGIPEPMFSEKRAPANLVRSLQCDHDAAAAVWDRNRECNVVASPESFVSNFKRLARSTASAWDLDASVLGDVPED
jgi:hypothetical protein